MCIVFGNLLTLHVTVCVDQSLTVGW